MSERAFVGREGELTAIAARVDAAAAGRAQVVWVEGDAGSGKSALLREVQQAPGPQHQIRGQPFEPAGSRPSAWPPSPAFRDAAFKTGSGPP